MKKSHSNNAEGRRFRIKALDIVIILLIVASVVAVYFRSNILDTLTGAKNLKEYNVSFEIKDIRYTTEKFINDDLNKKVYYEDGTELGTLIEASDISIYAISSSYAQKNFTTKDGKNVVSLPCPKDTRIDANGRLRCKGTISEDGYFLVGGTKYLAPGDTVPIKTAHVTLNITITNIEAVSK